MRELVTGSESTTFLFSFLRERSVPVLPEKSLCGTLQESIHAPLLLFTGFPHSHKSFPPNASLLTNANQSPEAEDEDPQPDFQPRTPLGRVPIENAP
mmetsp:Transcript_35081/g.69225  ORF Transcript_35081/g.69225 Transcript_35081/m.69225 type:complete len:97 (-) Transcript_35081:118-408(-)